ncbi:2,3-dihydro-2,3-dihydroxybenzoate dehydrogenase [Streptomyces sp. I05A-00742]|uniref:2,3-dihydro-2,3-dihydroxybenzoate dehydrogenase n=1 Tax=Streptomyces sp. I05A-00742 TaxID=2732853 RepID=UPI001487FF5B|nr:2,3-dihydro-2,3-dihydroxybenzoate dehydrogenase [Streptomyces sp. I05A-00742]
MSTLYGLRGTALVTGAAGGIGEAVVRALAAEGVAVALVDREKDVLGALAAELTAAGHRVLALPADVTSGSEVEAAVDTAERELGPIDHLVNGAGILRSGSVRDLTEDDWNAVLGVNATGVFHVSRAVADRMAPRRSGAIVTVASNAGRTPRMNLAAYAASKAAASMFTACLGLELAEYGIRCNVVGPGSTDTAMLTALWDDADAARAHSVDGVAEEYRLGIPLRKVARPEDIADSVLFLLSDRAAHITLHHLTVDGGATLGV